MAVGTCTGKCLGMDLPWRSVKGAASVQEGVGHILEGAERLGGRVLARDVRLSGGQRINHDVVFEQDEAFKPPAGLVSPAFETKHVQEKVAVAFFVDVFQLHQIGHPVLFGLHIDFDAHGKVIHANIGIGHEDGHDVHVRHDFDIGSNVGVKTHGSQLPPGGVIGFDAVKSEGDLVPIRPHRNGLRLMAAEEALAAGSQQQKERSQTHYGQLLFHYNSPYGCSSQICGGTGWQINSNMRCHLVLPSSPPHSHYSTRYQVLSKGYAAGVTVKWREIKWICLRQCFDRCHAACKLQWLVTQEVRFVRKRQEIVRRKKRDASKPLKNLAVGFWYDRMVFWSASVAQLVEQLTLNQLVHGSSPCRGTKFYKEFVNHPFPKMCRCI
jgi:hypothetical protein